MKLAKPTNTDTNLRIHNDIATGRGEFSACMLDILFYILSDFKKDERYYIVRVKDIEEITGRLWNYNQLQDASEIMGSRMFEIETNNSFLQLWLFSSVEYFKGTGGFEVELSQKAMPYLEDLKDNFTSMQLKSILHCSSKFAKRFYMMGCAWRGKGKVPQMTIGELKEMLGLKDPKGKQKEQYKQWGQFREKVLDKAVQQVNEHTDIKLTYKLTKRGRSFYWIDIFINYKAWHQGELDFSKPIEDQKTVKSIMNTGLSESQAVAIAKSPGGIEQFRIYKEKALKKIHTGDMEMSAFVPYIVAIYQKKGVLPRTKSID